MDLIATRFEQGLAQLNPSSIIGVFWLQTHFPSQEWDTLLSGEAAFGIDCIDQLIQDARLAGLNVDWEATVRR